MGLKVFEPQRLMDDRPDYVDMLPWNFRQEIIPEQQPNRDGGGQFIVPIPQSDIV